VADVPLDLRKAEQQERTAPAGREIEAAWNTLDGVYREMPEHPVVIGARAAAEWTTGRTKVSPMSRRVMEPDTNSIFWEGAEADMVGMGRRQGDLSYARGVAGWLFWMTGNQPLPRYLR
jgi:hypothetical protein